ncbi:hypothetical protein SKAU_G00158130 [Synaphobranchus kaupii]|uniref:Uncharacterized protein n=1 Tax=Synaphobranchus kaupii TaxID=118154 RepID=A0A9Q1FHY7_SYNKA|nr:hypothetical protein SKAU_G00158130 [Synaphobranchus kaupii]
MHALSSFLEHDSAKHLMLASPGNKKADPELGKDKADRVRAARTNPLQRLRVPPPTTQPRDHRDHPARVGSAARRQKGVLTRGPGGRGQVSGKTGVYGLRVPSPDRSQINRRKHAHFPGPHRDRTVGHDRPMQSLSSREAQLLNTTASAVYSGRVHARYVRLFTTLRFQRPRRSAERLAPSEAAAY